MTEKPPPGAREARMRRRADALLRLALDPAATEAERTLAAAKAAHFLRMCAQAA